MDLYAHVACAAGITHRPSPAGSSLSHLGFVLGRRAFKNRSEANSEDLSMLWIGARLGQVIPDINSDLIFILFDTLQPSPQSGPGFPDAGYDLPNVLDIYTLVERRLSPVPLASVPAIHLRISMISNNV